MIRVAVALNDLLTLKLLVALKVDLNEPGKDSGNTALHLATQKGESHQLVIGYLIESGVNIDMVNHKGEKPSINREAQDKPKNFES